MTTGKKIVLLIIIFSIIVLVLGWLWLQKVIVDFDLDVSTAIPALLKTFIQTPSFMYKL